MVGEFNIWDISIVDRELPSEDIYSDLHYAQQGYMGTNFVGNAMVFLC